MKISLSKILKSVGIFLLLLLFNNMAFTQLDWTEHLSHDRLTRNNLGFLFEENNLLLVMDNHSGPASTVERITGNEPKEIISEFDFNYEARSTSTGIDSKEIMLIKPESLDFYGFGATSIRMNNQGFSIRSLESLIDLPCADALLPFDTNKPMECLTNYEFEHLILNNEGEILTSYDSSPMTLHEGLEENYRVQNGHLYIHDGNNTSLLFDVPNFKKLYNNPYTEQLLVVLDSTIIFYNPVTFEINETTLETNPIAIDFTDDAMYYLSEVDNGYKIFKNYYSGGSNLWMDIDPAPNGQEVEIHEISIKGLNAYLFGVHYNELTQTRHHIVQKQNLLSPIGPPRKDIAIVSFSASYEQLGIEQYEYSYEIVVANNGTSVVNSFNVYSDIQEYNELYYTNIDYTYDGVLQPDEEVIIQGTFIAKTISKISINIPGADFMLDSYPSDNSGTYDLISSTTESKFSSFEISPNPTSGMVELELKEFSNPILNVLDIYGRIVLSPIIANNRIDISSIPDGQYYIQIIDKERMVTQPIVKF